MYNVIVDGLMEVTDELRWPGETWEQVFDTEGVSDYTTAREYLYTEVSESFKEHNIQWMINFLEDYMDGDDWLAYKCHFLRDFILDKYSQYLMW